MAILNSTENTCVIGFAGFPCSRLTMPELEKISCSVNGEFLIHPLELMGKHIRFSEATHIEARNVPLESSISSGRVLAVHLGSLEHGIETSLLIQQDGYYSSDYCDISKLTVLEVLG